MNRKQRKAKRLRACQHTQAARKDAKYWRDFQAHTGVDMQQVFKDLNSIGAQIKATNRLLDPPVPRRSAVRHGHS